MRAKQEDIDKINKAKTLYEVLGLRQDATLEQIKKAYRTLALTIHPDKNQGFETQVEPVFKKISNAHNILSDPESREQYDNTLRPSNPPRQEFSPSSKQEPSPPSRQESSTPLKKENSLIKKLRDALKNFCNNIVTFAKKLNVNNIKKEQKQEHTRSRKP